MSEGKTLVENSTYYASELWLGKLRGDGNVHIDENAAIVNATQLARMINAAINYARRAELKLSREELKRTGDTELAQLLLDKRLHELEWGRPMPEKSPTESDPFKVKVPT